MSREARDLGEIKAEFALKPVYSIAGATSENTDKIIAREVTGLERGTTIMSALCQNHGSESTH